MRPLLPANRFAWPTKRSDQRRTSNSVLPVPHMNRIQAYYANASEGYRDWSQNLNMHFGLYERGANPFDLEAMLEATNRRVIDELKLDEMNNHLLDMGCGLGGTARYAAKLKSVAKVSGITLAQNQVEEAQALCKGKSNAHKLIFIHADYHHTPFPDEHFNGAYAIESACHSEEKNKSRLLAEAYRTLKPGARFVLCDGFIKADKRSNRLTRLCYQKTCQHWALGHFPNLKMCIEQMQMQGFEEIQVKDISTRVLPSVLFIPWMILKYGAKLIARGDRNPHHWHHLIAPLWGLGLACNRNVFGYYIVSCRKPNNGHL